MQKVSFFILESVLHVFLQLTHSASGSLSTVGETTDAGVANGRSADLRFRYDALVGVPGVVVGLPGIFHFILINEFLLLLPAIINSTQAPLTAATGSPHRFVSDRDPDWIGVAGRKDACSHPRTTLDGDFEIQILQATVGVEPLPPGNLAIDKDFNRYIA